MKILNLLINILRNFMYEYIEKYEISNIKTIEISKRLDKLIVLNYN